MFQKYCTCYGESWPKHTKPLKNQDVCNRKNPFAHSAETPAPGTMQPSLSPGMSHRTPRAESPPIALSQQRDAKFQRFHFQTALSLQPGASASLAVGFPHLFVHRGSQSYAEMQRPRISHNFYLVSHLYCDISTQICDKGHLFSYSQ